MKNNPTSWWHNILFNKAIDGMQVENGQAMTIIKDKWIPKPSTFKLTSKHPEIPTDAKVSLLIDPCTRAW